MPTVSAAIVSYNSSDKIVEAATSLISNTKKYPLKLYIVDNCSQDNTQSIVENKIKEAVLIKSDKNGGFGYGHNKVLPFLESDYHIIVNPDIIVKDDVVSKMVDYLEERKDISMAMPNIINTDGTNQYLPKKKPKLKYLFGGRFERFGGVFKKWRREYTMYGEYDKTPVEIDFCSGCFTMIRTDVFKKIGGFDERYFMYFEDADLTRQAKDYGKTMLLPQLSVVHEWERASSKKLKYLIIQIKSMRQYFRKWKKK